MIVVPTANMMPYTEVPTTLVRARTLENGVCVGYANLSSAEGGLACTGGGAIVRPDRIDLAWENWGSMTPSSISLRVATGADEATVNGLLDACYPLLMREAYDPETFARALPRMVRINPALLESGTFYLAVTDGDAIVGCGGWTLEPPGGGTVKREVGHIRHFATHPERTSQGVGRTIYEACERGALRRDLRRFEVFASLNSQGFYGEMGFTRKRRIAVQLSEQVFLPAVLMRKALA